MLIVSLAAVTWRFRLVGRTRMLTEAWLRAGQSTVFVQAPSLRTGLERVLAPLRPQDEAPVVRPWPTWPARTWPFLGRRRLEAIIRGRARALRRTLERQIDWHASAAIVVSPLWTPWLDELPFAQVVYDCIDELRVHVPRAELVPLYQDWENQLIARADAAVVTAATLGAGLRARRPDLPLTVIRNGVDVERFTRLAAETPRPADLPAGRPIVGFVGALYDWIDWELIAATAARCPELEFVLVGPHDGRGDVQRVAALPNVRLLGPRPYAHVPAYIAAFDVCWVPFRQDDVGRAANPVKIYEYLALGKPVVTTPVADTDAFGDLVRVVRTADEAAGALRGYLAEPADPAAAIAFARENSWDRRAREYVEWLACGALRRPAPRVAE